MPTSRVSDPDALRIEVAVDGETVSSSATGGRFRGVARLIADVSEFMTLQAGDVLLLGAAHGAPLVHAGQQVTITIAGLDTITHRLPPLAQYSVGTVAQI